MKKDMECGDEMATDFYYAYCYHKDNYADYDLRWLRLWKVMLLDGTVIGGACFKGQPDENGSWDWMKCKCGLMRLIA
jgi:hypothetical protein